MDFFTCESIVVDYKLINRRSGLKLKCLNDGFVSYILAAFHFPRH